MRARPQFHRAARTRQAGMRGMLIKQHNWAGELAAHVVACGEALLAGSSSLRGGARQQQRQPAASSWLKAAAHARLRLHLDDAGSACCMELHLQQHLLLSCTLDEQRMALALLPASPPGRAQPLLVISPAAAQAAGRLCYCFRFFDEQDGSSFAAALQAQLQRAAQHRQQLAQEAAARGNAAAGAGGSEPQLQDATAADAPGQLLQGAAAAAAAATPARAAELKEAIKRHLLDPGFLELVDQVDALWDELERDLLGDEQQQQQRQ